MNTPNGIRVKGSPIVQVVDWKEKEVPGYIDNGIYVLPHFTRYPIISLRSLLTGARIDHISPLAAELLKLRKEHAA